MTEQKKHFRNLINQSLSKKLLKFLFVLAFFSNFAAFGQITIGSGTSNAFIPIYPYYGYTYSQTLYLQSEISNSGNITTLSFYFSGTSLNVSNNWTIYLGHTAKTAFSSTTDWIPTSSMTQVYSGTFASPSTSGWITIDISDFAYNGTSNLVIAVDENVAGYNTSSDFFYSTASTAGRSLYYYNDGTNPDPAAPPTGTLGTSYANVILGGITPLPAASLNFDGANDIVILNNNSTTLSGTFTVECWAKPSNTGTLSIMGSRAGGSNSSFDMKFSGGSLIHGDIGNGSTWLTTSADASFTYTPGTWYHIAYVVTPSGYTIYVNGAQRATGTFSGTPLLYNSTNKLTLGAYSSTGGECFNGNIDEVRIWSTARSQAQISAFMNCEIGATMTGLVANYHFNQGYSGATNSSVTTLNNAYSSLYNGTLTNFALTGATSNWTAPGAVTSGSSCVFVGDNCSNAQDLTTLSSPYSASTVGYTDDVSICKTGYGDRVFYINVPNGSQIDIWESSNDYDEYEYMGYGGSCPGSTTITCWDNDALSHNVWYNNTGSAQTVWYVQDGLSATGNFTLNWSLTTPVTYSVSISNSYTGSPVDGSTTYVSGASFYATPGTRPGYICTGYTGSGSIAASSSDLYVSVNITSNSTLNWTWASCAPSGTYYLMTNGSYNVCEGTFYDAGGNCQYNNNESYTTTFNPSIPGNKVVMNFTSFSTENNYDGLMIYNGPNTSSPLISSGLAVGSNATTCPAGSWRGTGSPGTITSTDVSGALTFVYTSEGSGTSTGWTANISVICNATCSITGPSIACSSTNISYTASASGFCGTPSYQWYCNGIALATSGGGSAPNYSSYSGGTSQTLNLSTFAGSFSPVNIYCVTSYGSCTATSSTIALSVSGTQSTAPTSITGSSTICNGSSTTLTSSGGTLGTDATTVWYTGSCGTDIYNQPWTNQPFGTGSTIVNSVSGGILNVTSTTSDPIIDMSGLGSFNPSVYKYINVRYRVTAGSTSGVEIFFYNTLHNYAVGGETGYGSLISDGAWHVVNVDMSADPDYTTGGNILGWRFDWATASGVTMDIDYISLSDVPVINEGSSITVSPTTNTTYYTANRGACNTTTCANTTVTVNSLSTAPTSISGTTTICAGGSTTLSVNGGTDGTGASYQWFSTSCGGTSAGTGSSISVTPAFTTTYFVRRSGTCNNTSCASTVVSVNSLSYTPTGATATPTSLCTGGTSTLNVGLPNTLNGGLLDYNTWTVGSGSATGFSQNGETADNQRINGTDPWGNTTVIWETRPSGDGNADGGWNSDFKNIDNTKLYRVSVWVRRTSATSGGTFYLGTNGSPSEVRKVSDGTEAGNPYWDCASTGALGQNEWYLVVGHVFSNTYAGATSHAESGYYTVSSGKVHENNGCNVGPDVKFAATTTQLRQRAYHFYCSDATTRLQFAYPRIDMCDGTEPTIAQLLKGFDSNDGLGTGASWKWYSGSCGGSVVGTGPTISVSPSSSTSYFVRAEGTCNTTACSSVRISIESPAVPTITPSGSTTICPGSSVNLTASDNVSGNALSFNATGQYVNVGNPSDLKITGNQTIEMWLKPFDFSYRYNPYNKAYAGEGTITQETNGSITYFYGTDGNNGATYQGHGSGVIPLNQWTHVAIVRDLSSMQLRWYINGVLSTSVAASYPAAVAGANDVTIGKGYASTQGYNGLIDEVRVWNVARTQPEIQATMNTTVAPGTSGLKGYWRFDESSGTATSSMGSLTASCSIVGSPSWVASAAPIQTAFSWSPSTGLNTTAAAIVTASPSSTTTYTVTASSPNGCTSTNTVTISLKTNVGITSATAATSPICAASTTTVTANGVVGTNAVVTWWSATGGTGTNLGTGTTKTVGPGTYYARVTGDCGSAVESSVTVASKINVGITSATFAASPICATSTTTVTANGVTGTGAVVTWYTGAGGTGTNLGTGTTKTVGPGTYYARVTGDCGSAVEASVTVASKINVGITSATFAASPICATSTTTVTANGVVGTSAVVTWYTGTGGTGTNLGTSNPLTVGPGTYYARVTGDCGSAVEASVTVASKINVGITSATAATSPICAASTTTVTANGVSGTNAVVTWWSATGGTGTNLGTGTTKTVGPGTYYARVTGDCGSAVESSVTVASKINVGITSATFAASPICATSTTTVTANGVVGTSAVVTWYTGTGGTGTNLGTGTTKTVGPGTYYARVTGDCGSAVEASVTVASKINVGITSATADASPICAASTTTVTANGVTGTNAVVTWWSATGGTGTNLGTGSTKTFGPGTYYARVTGDCGTAVEASVTVASKINVGITSATAATSPICAASTTTVTANGVVGTNAVTTWYTGTGGTGTNLGTGTTKTVGPGTYYARVTGDCGTAVEASVTVASKINVGITSATADASPICAASTTTVTANGVSGTNAVVTWWSATGGTGTNLGTGSTKTFGPGTYYARVTGDCGSAVEASVTVASKINVGITSATAATSPICAASTTTVTANGVTGTNAIVTWWSATGGTGTNLGTGTTKTFGPGTYYARVTGDCGSAVEASVTVASKINVGITSATADASPICAASTTTVTANGVTGTNAVVTWWSATGGTGTNYGTGTSKLVGPGTYYARVTGDCGTAAEASVTVVLNTESTAPTSISATNNSTCGATSKVLSIVGGSLGAGATWNWFTASCGGAPAGTGLSISVNPASTTTYYARAAGTCNTTSCASIIVTVIPAPENDLCADATVISSFPYSSGVKSTNCALNDTPPVGASSSGAHDYNVWYKFTGNGNQVAINTCDDLTNFDTELHVYTGSCGSMTEQISNDEGLDAACSLGKSSLTMCTVNGTVYYISVGSYQLGGATGNYVLNVIDKAITAATILPNSVCGNGTVTLTANVGNNADAVEFSIDGGTSVSATDASVPYQYTTASLTAPQTVSVYVRSRNSESSCVGNWVNSGLANAYSLPTSTIQALCNDNLGRKIEVVGAGGSLTYSTFEQQSPSVSQASNVFAVPFNNTRDFRVIDNRGCTSSWASYVAPSTPSDIATTATSGSCIVRGVGSWWHVTDASNHVILSIDDNTSNLGEITANSYVEPTTSVYKQTYYLKRHFKITSQNTPTSPVTLRLYFTDEELNELITNSKLNQNVADDVNDLSNLKVTRYSGVNEDNIYSNNDTTCGACFTVYTPSTGVDMGANYVQITVPGFSEEWIHGGTNNTSILPIELMTFKPECLGKNGFIRWITASEINNNFFVLERSENGIDFQSIAQIQGAGNSSEILEYSYLDTQKPEGLVYYRLKQVDFNGVIHTYNPVPLSCKNESMALRVVPNPFKEKISIIGSLPNETQIELFNGKGARVYSESKNIVNSTELDLNFLAPGIYLLRLTELNGIVHQFKLVRN